MAALAAVLLAALARAQIVTTVVNNGPPADLYDIVILGDGYTAAQRATFDADVLRIVNELRNNPTNFPYGAYFNLYNVHSVYRASVEDLADKPPLNVFRNTAYDATYWYGNTERCLYIQNTALAAADAALAPDTDGRVIVLVNDPKYGGCGGTYSVSYNGTDGPNVQAHEWGHSFGQLADEYDYGSSGTYSGPEPSQANITKDAVGNVKWPLWYLATGQYGQVRSYLGAGYYTQGLYRPESDCEMRTLYRRFCTICREHMIKRFHQECVTIGSPTPASPLTRPRASAVTFSFTNRIAARPHTIEWRVDAGAFAPGTATFVWNVGNASLGGHTVQARLTDTSPEVRSDPTNLRIETFTWNVNVIANTVVSPIEAAAGEGNGASGVPLIDATPRRYQQIHGDLLGSAKTITNLAWRQNGAANVTYTGVATIDLELAMAHARPVTQLSFAFGGNYLGPRTTTFARRLVNFGPQGLATPGPNPFPVQLTIAQDVPFAYDGANALLWEAVVYANALSGTLNLLDAHSLAPNVGGSVSTGNGCTVTGQTLPVQHVLDLSDHGGTLLMNVRVSRAPASQPCVLALGAADPAWTFPGLCSLLRTDLALTLGIGSTDATGAITADAPVGRTFLLANGAGGATLYTQVHCVDPARAVPIANSNGLRVTVPMPSPASLRVARLFNDLGGVAATQGVFAATSTLGYGLVTRFGY